jgi:hypothetical protein
MPIGAAKAVYQGYQPAAADTTIYMALTEDASPFLSLYDQDGTTFTESGSASANPAGRGYSVNYSTDGVYLAVGSDVSPYLEIYKRSGDTYTKISSPFDTAPSSRIWQVQFSTDANSDYLYASVGSSPYFYAWSRSGDSWTKLSDPSNLPTAQARGCATYGDYIAVAQLSYGSDSGQTAVTNVHFYKNTSGSISRVDSDDTAAGRMINAAWSADGTYVGFTMNDNNPRYAIYKRSGDTFTLLSSPLSVGGTAAGRGLEFSPDGGYALLACNETASLRFYTKDSGADTWTHISGQDKDLGSTFFQENDCCTWSKDGTYVYAISGTSPFLYVYERSGDTFSLVSGTPTANNGGAVAVYPNHYTGTS